MVETHPELRQMVVAHRPIDNYMPAMTMAFTVGHGVGLDQLTPGTRVGFELRVNKHASIVQKVQIRASRSNLKLPKTPINNVVVGLKVPSFSLIDQNGKTVSLSDFEGKVVVVDFIYTRCPLPDVCPRLSAIRSTTRRRFSRSMRGAGRPETRGDF